MHSPRRKIYLYNANGYYDSIEIVKDIINGIDITLVDPEIFPHLTPVLGDYIFRSEKRNDEIGLNRLNFALDYITKYPQKLAIEQKLLPDRSPKKVRPPPMTKEQLETELEALFSGDLNRNYNREELNYIVSSIRKKKVEFISNQELDEADQCDAIIRTISLSSQTEETNQILQQKLTETSSKLSESRQHYEELQHRWTTVINNFLTFKKEELDKLQKSLNGEYKQQVKKKNQPAPPRYRKASTYLQSLQMRERAFVSSKQFLEAEEARQEALAQEEIEREIQDKKWKQYCRANLKKLSALHNKQIEIRKANLEKEERKIRKQAKEDLERERRKIYRLESIEEENKSLINKIQEATTGRATLPPLDLGTASLNQDAVNPMTPETFRQKRILNTRLYSRKRLKTAR